MNIVPFGHDYNGANITGISSASFSLFGIPPKELNIAQSAYLIGLLQSPYGYTPYDDNGNLKSNEEFKYSIQRQHYVLKRMLVEGKISKQYIRAKIQYQSTPTNTSTTRCIIIDNYIIKGSSGNHPFARAFYHDSCFL